MLKETNKILKGNALDVLRALPDECVDCVITSPPYFMVRKYGDEAVVEWPDGIRSELGREPSVDLYLDHLVMILAEVKRVLKKTGTIFFVMGDTYGVTFSDEKRGEGGMVCRGKQFEKSLGLIPYRFAMKAMDELGLIIRNLIVWHKPNHLPSSVRDRFTNSYEVIIFMTKSKKYFFNLDAVKVLPRVDTIARTFRGVASTRYKDATYDGGGGGFRRRLNIKEIMEEIGSGKNNEGKDTFLELQHPKLLGADVGTRMRPPPQLGKGYTPSVKNPSDCWISGEYIEGEGHSNRAGLNRPLSDKEVEIIEVIQRLMAEFLKKCIRKEDYVRLDKIFGTRWRHWIRTDFSEACLPSAEDLIRLKEILGFDEGFDAIIERYSVIYHRAGGKSLDDLWHLSTEAFYEEHFAVFPQKLVERLLLCGCPAEVCAKCGMPRMPRRVYEGEYEKSYGKGRRIADVVGASPSSVFRTGRIKRYKIEWEGCGCNAGTIPGLVLDPFIGSGTVAVVAQRLNRRWLGIEIVDKYIQIAEKRIKGVVPVLFENLYGQREELTKFEYMLDEN